MYIRDDNILKQLIFLLKIELLKINFKFFIDIKFA